jgi:hypothetical protein
MHWKMIKRISKGCELLVNTKSPQFHSAQLFRVEEFGQMVHNRLLEHNVPTGNLLVDPVATQQLLSLNWSMILCRNFFDDFFFKFPFYAV